MFGLPKEIAGTIIAAAIAAFISLVGLIISKESKVSELRQAWIDALREEIAEVVTQSRALLHSYRAGFKDNTVLWQSGREGFEKLNEAWAKIKLRLNPNEELSIAVFKALEEHENNFPPDRMPDLKKLDESERKLLGCTGILLKKEWKRVKYGEPVYKIAEALTALFFIGGLYLLLSPLVPSLSFNAPHRSQYRVIERSDNYVDKQGQPASELSYDHDEVGFVLAHDDHKIHALCDLSTLDKMNPQASCGLRPLHNYECSLGRDDVMKAPMPLSDLTCLDGDGRQVYLYVSKEE